MEAKEAIRQKFQELKGTISKLEIELRASRSRISAFTIALPILQKGDATDFAVRKLEDKVRKEKQTQNDLEIRLADLGDQISAFEETLKILGKPQEENGTPELRVGSELFKIREAMKAKGSPMTLTEMVAVIGKEDTTKSRNSMRGSIARYARTGTIFVKTAASTFGLVELGHKPGSEYI
jgi:chromosome segregation ATPase